MDYPPMRGGVARYLSSLAQASDGGMEVVVPIGHEIPPAPLSQGGVSEVENRLSKAQFWWAGWPKWLPLIGSIRKSKHNILVSHVLPVGTAAWIASMFGGPGYFLLFHGTDLKRINNRRKLWMFRRIASKAKGLIVNSKATERALKKLLPQSRALLLTPGVTQFDAYERNAVRNELGIATEEKIILTVCRLVERKGVDVLLQALAQVREKHPEAKLVAVGKGPYAPPLRALANMLELDVRWIEDAEDEDVAKWYAASDIFCLPSREEADDVEGFGIVFLEAAAAGLPVIAGRGWGTEEAVEDGKTGLLVAPDAEHVADALGKLLSDENLRRSMGKSGRERALQDFKWQDRWEKLSAFCLGQEDRPIESDISVVIPCYNHAKELESALESLAGQTLQAKEIVVVDNASDDHPELVTESFAGRLPIKLVRYAEKRGAPAARNFGANLTDGALIIFMDADVEFVPTALEAMRRALAESGADFAYSDFMWGRKRFKGREWDAESLKGNNWIHTTSLIRRSSWRPFDESLKRLQDWDLWLSMSEDGKRGVWVPQLLFSVTERKTGGMSKWLPSFIHRIPWPVLGWTPQEMKNFRLAKEIVMRKHNVRNGK